jgi:hypothetical protein
MLETLRHIQRLAHSNKSSLAVFERVCMQCLNEFIPLSRQSKADRYLINDQQRCMSNIENRCPNSGASCSGCWCI